MFHVFNFLTFLLLVCVQALPVTVISSDERSHLDGDPPVTHKVSFEITSFFTNTDSNELETSSQGKLVLGLFGTVAPKTVNNFVGLSNMTYGYGYLNSKFHRIIEDFMVQGGDYERSDGTGGKSIYGGQFDDETFQIHHDKVGRLSMANAGPNTNGGQFFITTANACEWLNGHHVVFGQLIGGFDVLQVLNTAQADRSKPIKDWKITNIEVVTIHDTGVIVQTEENPVLETPEVVEYIGDTSNYNFLVVFLVILLVVVVMKRLYFRRQYVIDIKDSNYF
ncbi:Peptidyl-prolyl cis-trans isomerase D [Yamadazyma tenuis]|uniref:Peptidyl-prolyl cis-trans isomerase n=1 Tax=Candida tenuis (strain ATCC 10573 / BCRC 21748 / CBS 615 / JCM 9827 / NBRC 10315 / NRRL Y-1498 / VKM Y-70) TaxID=590646 RepID=G3B308_CANTC|nr:uncharacterized protein CANTEDRAFT_98048 [Yamadazyma tenuis ATCC 10573]EGV64051.1 hypothetical protein CANTEDRAFT_98048 [Yamadazyma tenuis ATCC 10573]WEJ96319.1 Peptidyl-prolyl cis-trans isomerase D [Yamadazyma tenuis]